MQRETRQHKKTETEEHLSRDSIKQVKWDSLHTFKQEQLLGNHGIQGWGKGDKYNEPLRLNLALCGNGGWGVSPSKTCFLKKLDPRPSSEASSSPW